MSWQKLENKLKKSSRKNEIATCRIHVYYWKLSYKMFIDPKIDLSEKDRPWTHLHRMRHDMGKLVDMVSTLDLAALLSHFTKEPLRLKWLSESQEHVFRREFYSSSSGFQQIVQFTSGKLISPVCATVERYFLISPLSIKTFQRHISFRTIIYFNDTHQTFQKHFYALTSTLYSMLVDPSSTQCQLFIV